MRLLQHLYKKIICFNIIEPFVTTLSEEEPKKRKRKIAKHEELMPFSIFPFTRLCDGLLFVFFCQNPSQSRTMGYNKICFLMGQTPPSLPRDLLLQMIKHSPLLRMLFVRVKTLHAHKKRKRDGQPRNKPN